MTAPPPSSPRVRLVADRDALRRICDDAARAAEIALDVEADGLHHYRPKLCVVQLAWPTSASGDEPGLEVAVVDALSTPLDPLAELVSTTPVVVHDLTFDARMLHEAGAPLSEVRDTSIAARLLGRKETGLAAIALDVCGAKLDKKLQHHDWARRPLTARHLTYLASDVLHLPAIAAALFAEARALDIEEEIAEECRYRLHLATLPSTDDRPPYARIKGVSTLSPEARAVLRRLAALRDELAEAADVPPFHVASNAVLLELAEHPPATLAELSGRGSALGRAPPARWWAALEAGRADRDVPADEAHFLEPVRVDPDEARARKRWQQQLGAWRSEEARRRGVDPQAVLPGHCVRSLADALVRADDEASARAGIRAVPGIGRRRLERHLESWLSLWRGPEGPG